MSNKRTDQHAPSTFDPAKYSYEGVVCLDIPKEVKFLMAEVPGMAAQLRAEWLADRKALDARVKEGGFKGNFVRKGTCDHCGAWFLYGAEFHHEDGEVIVVGHTCADNAFGHADRVSYDKDRAAKIVRGRKIRVKKMIQAKGFMAEHKLASVFTKAHMEAEGFAGETLADMYERLVQYGSLSEKQIAFAKKLADEIDNPPEIKCDFCGGEHTAKDCPNRHAVPVTDDRIEIRGIVRSAGWRDNAYGMSLKGLVETVDGYRIWTTLPTSFLDEAYEAYEGDDYDAERHVRGLGISFHAKIKRSDRDATFGFASRPTKGCVIDTAEIVFNPKTPVGPDDIELAAALQEARG